jgi:hypothetical protein
MKRLSLLALVCGLGLFTVGCSSNQESGVVGGTEGASTAEVQQKNDDYMAKMKAAQEQQATQQAGGTPGQ